VTLSSDERVLAKQCYDMYRNRWREKGPGRAAEKGYNICIGLLEEGGTMEVPEFKKREYRDFFEALARGEVG
jgi:hypothetical protein